jgi:chemotaxis protein methyltransferase CheR
MRGELLDSPLAPYTITDREFGEFRTLIHRTAGIALGPEKRALLCARLGRRLRHLRYATFTEYLEHLRDRDPAGQELARMINAVTTKKTDFFREGHHFAFLRDTVLGPLVAPGYAGPRRLRIWSAACSSGEEPYSIAFTVLERLGSLLGWDVKILASDIDTDILASAQEGRYVRDRLAGIAPGLLERYMTRDPCTDVHQVRQSVRDLIAFRRINFHDAGWPIRTSFDAVFCRNVLIYFDRAMQREMIGRLMGFVKPLGFLFLGHSESALGMRAGLRRVGNTVYQRVEAASTTERGHESP